MKKSKLTQEQIVRILKEVEAGAKVAETWGKHGIMPDRPHQARSRDCVA